MWLRMTHQGYLPRFELGPGCLPARLGMAFIQSILPRAEFTDLRALLEKHIRFDDLPRLIGPRSPVLLVGAANVGTGELKKFNSRRGEIDADAILASAAVPALFPAVRVAENYYWDGLYSDNPPVHELITLTSVGPHRIPDEIWIIQINPAHYKGAPSTPDQIIDRRNQMVGNLSLMQNLEIVKLINLLLQAGALDPEVLGKADITKHDPFEVRFIRMSDEVQESLDYVNKLTRGPDHIRALMADVEQQGRAFVEQYVAT
ncbi:MAG TPA: patatin-like phospholipase family protein, partial [Tepidisphaeraceae bacterium]|nr:patatin-like phospholipase family protein [Tepidisphaeraceae bacterium]